MDRPDTRHFHQLYGEKKQRATYQKKDFADYTLMTLLSGAVVCLVYGAAHPMSLAAIVAAAGLGWWRLTAYYDARGYDRRAVEDTAAMRAHLDQSQLRLSESFEEKPAGSTIPAGWSRAGGN
mgnify:CR=1 FL=1